MRQDEYQENKPGMFEPGDFDKACLTTFLLLGIAAFIKILFFM